jgi:hypothetical protein|tara:strand:+ start:2783 stop:2986 length:204 start_codon:yes stop_codon:yes gene_type:complete
MLRFSKENLLTQLQNKINHMESIWGFVSDNGTNQIKDKTDFDRVIAYGEYNAVLDIYESIKDGNYFI